MERSTKEERAAIEAVLERMDREDTLTPDNVISEAQKPDSPLHGEFTWDVQEAARITWIEQARALISSFRVKFVVGRTEYDIQQFIQHPTKPSHVQGYTAVTNLKSSKALAREFVEQQIAIASTYVQKTADFAAVLGLSKRVEHLLADLDNLRSDTRATGGAEQPTA